MLSVILTVLKIIGLILLWLLIIVLALLLIILAVPIRYRVRGVVKGTYDVEAKVTWLLHLISFSFSFRDMKAEFGLKVLGISLMKKKKGSEESADDEAPSDESPGEEPASPASTQAAATSEPSVSSAAAAAKEEKEEKKGSKEKEKKPEKEKKKPEEKKEKEKERPETSSEENASEDEVLPFPENIIEALRKIKHKISDIIHKFDPDGSLMQKADFITNLRTKHAIGLALRFVGKLFKHILPYKASGYLKYGFEDPSLTGRLLAAAAALIPLHKNSITLIPDFQEPVFETDALLKGRICLGYIVVKAVGLVLKRDVIFVLRNFKKYF